MMGEALTFEQAFDEAFVTAQSIPGTRDPAQFMFQAGILYGNPEVESLREEKFKPSPCGIEGHRLVDWMPAVSGSELYNKDFCLACRRELALRQQKEQAEAALSKYASVENKSHLQTIDERDEAEEALSQAYFLITGNSPEWSNNFGFDEAISDIDDAQKTLRAELNTLRQQIDSLAKELARVNDEYILETAKRLESEGQKEQAERERDEARAACAVNGDALEKYGQHKDGCAWATELPTGNNQFWGCDCGLDSAINAPKPGSPLLTEVAALRAEVEELKEAEKMWEAMHNDRESEFHKFLDTIGVPRSQCGSPNATDGSYARVSNYIAALREAKKAGDELAKAVEYGNNPFAGSDWEPTMAVALEAYRALSPATQEATKEGSKT